MVALNRIYTRTGDAGTTSLGTGERRLKSDLRVAAYGTIDEANACLGIVRLHTAGEAVIDAMLARIQNDLFDLGADLCTPPSDAATGESLRIVEGQVVRLEREIDQLNAELSPLRSFVLPGGTAEAAGLHLARTVVRRAERLMVDLAQREAVGAPALRYVNRLSDLLFVMARHANRVDGEPLWTPGSTRPGPPRDPVS